MLEQEAKVERDEVFIASSLLWVGGGLGGCSEGCVTWVRVTMVVRPWDTPLIARNVNAPGGGVLGGM